MKKNTKEELGMERKIESNPLGWDLIDPHRYDDPPVKAEWCEWCGGGKDGAPGCDNELYFYHFPEGKAGWYSDDCSDMVIELMRIMEKDCD